MPHSSTTKSKKKTRVKAVEPEAPTPLATLSPEDNTAAVQVSHLVADARNRLHVMILGQKQLWTQLQAQYGLPEQHNWNPETGVIMETPPKESTDG